MFCDRTPTAFPHDSEDTKLAPSLATHLQVSNAPPQTKFRRTIWYPLAYASLFIISFICALDVGDYPGAWSSLIIFPTWLSGNTYHGITSTVIFTAATTTMHHLNQNDAYQDCFLFAAISSAIGFDVFLDVGLKKLILKALSGAVLMAMGFSFVMHRLLGRTDRIIVDIEDGGQGWEDGMDGMERP